MNAKLEALKHLLEMMDLDDFHLVHDVVRRDVEDGMLSKELENEYREMVDTIVENRKREVK